MGTCPHCGTNLIWKLDEIKIGKDLLCPNCKGVTYYCKWCGGNIKRDQEVKLCTKCGWFICPNCSGDNWPGCNCLGLSRKGVDNFGE